MEKRFIARAPLSTTSHRRCASLLRVRIAGQDPLPASKQKESDISLRSRRRKCVISTGSSSCTFCVSRGVACTNGTLALSPKSGNSPRGHGPVVSTPTTPGEQSPDKYAQLPPMPLRLELIELYFDFIHDQFHHLFHRPTFLDDAVQQRVPPIIIYAISALSARFSKNQAFAGIKVWERSTGFAKEAAQLLDVCDLSLATIQACVLLGTLNRTEGQGALETIHYSVACRMAQLLDLPNRPAENAIERELNLRVWWTLSKVDVWSSAGVGLPRQMPPIDDFPLPVDEDTFRSWGRDIPVSVTDSNTDRKSSLFAQMLILTRILVRILDFHKAIVSGNTPPSDFSAKTTELSKSLDSWHNTLPTQLQDTAENMEAHGAKGLGRIFVALHIGYYHCGQLLFYQFLQEDCHGSLQDAQAYASKCRFYATSLCDLLDRSSRAPDCSVLYTMVGHDLVIASTVQVHTLLFSSSDSEISSANRRLTRNFEILSNLKEYWPVLETSFMRLRTFQEACTGKGMETSFAMNRWMVRFLYEFARPVGERKELDSKGRPWTDSQLWSVENIGINQ
ncbi:hypothetical protein BP5796_11122 [Coleophoma crateriformis]|uniref:Xylanolytic transcriptional activator regulatory domain-containing protein n=1 Tax=Coleophoma crateriformis TaxID=565419 RepID=A0A3D8QMF0_9HELO|nr:hypothetical protein BP5796_11122 [Coleophoma crateriformis]